MHIYRYTQLTQLNLVRSIKNYIKLVLISVTTDLYLGKIKRFPSNGCRNALELFTTSPTAPGDLFKRQL